MAAGMVSSGSILLTTPSPFRRPWRSPTSGAGTASVPSRRRWRDPCSRRDLIRLSLRWRVCSNPHRPRTFGGLFRKLCVLLAGYRLHRPGRYPTSRDLHIAAQTHLALPPVAGLASSLCSQTSICAFCRRLCGLWTRRASSRIGHDLRPLSQLQARF